MAYQTSMVKDLSISLEALSRINGADAYFQQVCSLLQDAIDKTKKEFKRPDEDETSTTTDDDIPF